MSTEAEKLEAMVQAMVQAMVSALNINKDLRRKIADLERKLAEKDVLLSVMQSLEERKFRDLTEQVAKQQAVISKLKEQRNEELEDNCYEPERPFEVVKAAMDAELAEMGE